MKDWLLYIFVMLVFLPGIFAFIFWSKCWRFPVLSATFLGMFAFNGIGSISVFIDEKIYPLAFDTGPVSEVLCLIIIFQALLFYLVAGVYMALRKPVDIRFRSDVVDIVICVIIIFSIIALASSYYSETGGFLITKSWNGSMNVDNAYAFRMKYIYGLSNWPIYNIGFVFLPVILSGYAFIIFKSDNHYFGFFVLAMLGSFIASLSMGSKGGVFGFVLILGIAYMTWHGMNGRSALAIFADWRFLFFALTSFVFLIYGYIHATPEKLSFESLLSRLWYRIFVAYPEALAAAVSYSNLYGEVGKSIFPTLRGFFSHEQINISAAIHFYQAGVAGGASVPVAGEAFLSAGWMGLVLILPVVYLTLIFIQELAFCMNKGLVSIALSSVYAYLGLGLSMNGMFASLYNLMYPGALIIIGLISFAVIWGVEHLKIYSKSNKHAQYQ